MTCTKFLTYKITSYDNDDGTLCFLRLARVSGIIGSVLDNAQRQATAQGRIMIILFDLRLPFRSTSRPPDLNRTLIVDYCHSTLHFCQPRFSHCRYLFVQCLCAGLFGVHVSISLPIAPIYTCKSLNTDLKATGNDDKAVVRRAFVPSCHLGDALRGRRGGS
ncbi:hypothetical protein BKA62DRAFT_307676 [Auriculariales sp. MPI-PUGE-AT-0066]|nr:hypothetical protein BKA62DRAFT_307676 [Auriculariales sp. MPI-PUGE-AT-0066]